MSPGGDSIPSYYLSSCIMYTLEVVTINKGMSHIPGMLITIVLRNDPDEHHR